jgi:hypothetical protein
MNTGSTMKIWFEELPEQCPEADARKPNGEVFYRLIENEVIKCQDFWSHRKIWPHKAFNTTECRARSVSIFETLPECEKLLLLSFHEDKMIAEVNLTKDAGLVKRTGKQPGHHSWWRSEAFDPVANARLIQSNADHG